MRASHDYMVNLHKDLEKLRERYLKSSGSTSETMPNLGLTDNVLVADAQSDWDEEARKMAKEQSQEWDIPSHAQNKSSQSGPATTSHAGVPSEEDSPEYQAAVAASLATNAEEELKRLQEARHHNLSDREFMEELWEKIFGTNIWSAEQEFERRWKMVKGENLDSGTAYGDDGMPALEEVKDEGQGNPQIELTDTAKIDPQAQAKMRHLAAHVAISRQQQKRGPKKSPHSKLGVTAHTKNAVQTRKASGGDTYQASNPSLSKRHDDQNQSGDRDLFDLVEGNEEQASRKSIRPVSRISGAGEEEWRKERHQDRERWAQDNREWIASKRKKLEEDLRKQLERLEVNLRDELEFDGATEEEIEDFLKVMKQGG